MTDRASAVDSLIGLELSHYRLIEKIGSGGMGVVYRALDAHLNREVAIKVLSPGTITDESARKHLRKEALALSNACSPRKNEGLRRQISGVLAGFAALLQFFSRVYTHLHVGQDVWQADIQGLQQITTGRIRPGDAQATATAFAFHFR